MATPINSSGINNATAAVEALNRALKTTVQAFTSVNRKATGLKKLESNFGKIYQRISATEVAAKKLETRLSSLSTSMNAIVQASADFKNNMNSVQVPTVPAPSAAASDSGDASNLLENGNEAKADSANADSAKKTRMQKLRTPPPTELMPVFGAIAAFTSQLMIAAGAVSINEALKEKQMKDMLATQTGSEKTGTQIFQNASASALKLGIDKSEAVNVALSLTSTAQDTDQLGRMTNMSTQMGYLSNGGATSAEAADAIQVAMTGDFTGLTDKFNIAKEEIESAGLSKFVEAKDMNGFLDAMDQILEKSNLGKSALDTMLSSPLNQLTVLKGQLKSSFASAGQGAVALLQPILAKLIEAFESGKFQPFFDMIHVGLSMAADLFGMVVDSVIWLFSVFGQFWPIIGGVLTALVAVLLPAILIGLWAMVAPLVAQAIAWLAPFWPIFAIIGAVALLLAFLMNFGLTAEMIIGYVVGMFYYLYSKIHNIIALLWNHFVSFAEFLTNAFIDPLYAIQKAFYDVFKNIFDFVINIFNSIFSGIDKMLELVGSDMRLNIKWNSDFIEAFKPEDSNRPVKDFSSMKLDQINSTDAFSEGYKKGGSFVHQATGAIDGFKGKLDGAFPDSKEISELPTTPTDQQGFGGTQPDINRVNEVGSINETVDISSEDLKTMRELAEMKNIQNFVSLQPSVSVQTGDINSGHDIDTIIGRIEKTLNEQIATSAEGVYA